MAVLEVPATVVLFPAVRHPSVTTPLTNPVSLNPVVTAVVVTILPVPWGPDKAHAWRGNWLVDRRRRSDVDIDINPCRAGNRRKCGTSDQSCKQNALSNEHNAPPVMVRDHRM